MKKRKEFDGERRASRRIYIYMYVYVSSPNKKRKRKKDGEGGGVLDLIT